MACQITFESFERLLEDNVFVDYLNKFCSLPVFGERIVYRKSLRKVLIDPKLTEDAQDKNALYWLWENRLPFFFRSHIYAEYKLAKALIEYDLNEDGGVEMGLATALEELQCRSFSKMSRFSKFCKFLSETGEGLKLVAFFIAAQHVFVAFYEGDPDSAIHIGELRDKFFDETSYWCLPKKVLENCAYADQSTSVAFCMVVSQRVLSRICLYWLPRYLLHLRLKGMERHSGPEIDSTKQYLHELVFRIKNMKPEEARNSVSLRGFRLLKDGAQEGELQSRRSSTDKEDSITDLFPMRAQPSDSERKRATNVSDRRTESRFMQRSRSKASIAIPGAEIKIERKTSKRPTMLQLSTVSMFGASLRQTKLAGPTADDGNKRTTNLEQIRATRLEKKKQDRLNAAGMSKSTMRKASGLRNASSISNLASKVASVTKAVSKFKLAKNTVQKDAGPKNTQSLMQALNRPANQPVSSSTDIRKVPKKTAKKDGAIPEQMNVIKFKTGDLLNGNVEKKMEKKSKKDKKKEDDSAKAKASSIKLSETSADESVDTDLEEVEKKSNSKISKTGGFASLIQARSIALKWKKGTMANVEERKSLQGSTDSPEVVKKPKSAFPNLKSKLKKVEDDPPRAKDDPKSKADLKPKSETKSEQKKDDKPETSGLKNSKGSKMIFAMSDQTDENKVIKVLTKKDNRVMENVIKETETEEPTQKDSEDLPGNYLRNRRNAMHKIKPLKTLRKRPHSQLPTAAAEKQVEKRSGQNRRNSQVKIKVEQSPYEKRMGERKAEFIKKALMVNTTGLQERIKAPEQAGDERNPAGDYSTAFYSIHEDQIYRHEMRHLRAALRSDDFAAGPFLAYVTDTRSDEAAMLALCFWQEVERFREEFSGMQQSDLVLTMDQILTKYVLNDRGFQFIPGMREFSVYIFEIDVQSCLTFPWPLRLVQRKCMDLLKELWEEFILGDAQSFFESAQNVDEDNLTVENISGLIKNVFAEEVPPAPTVEQMNKRDSTPKRRTQVSQLEKKESKDRESRTRRGVSARPTKLINKFAPLSRPTSGVDRESLPSFGGGHYAPSRVGGTMHRAALESKAMARRCYRAYLLAEQTCRLTAKMPQSDNFLDDESDEEGFMKPKPPPIYLRPPVIDKKMMALMSSKEYPGKGPVQKRTHITRVAEKSKTPSYMKDTIRKNGVTIRRPVLRPKHLVDCLRDPVHFEFFRRFAKCFHFERSVRFWKAVEVMKHIEDPKIRQAKIRSILNQFFAKGATTGVGVDGQVLRDIMRTPPEKVTVSMLISAQACVMKALEDTWGERYLSTFVDVKKSQAQKERMDRTEIMKMAQSNGKMTSIWRVFYAFIKRSAKFIATMRNRQLRTEFELYLQTVGRDPTVYHKEGWSEISASSYDIHMNPETVFHQKKQQGRLIIAELLINDFRFWCEVECYRSQAEQIQQNGDEGNYSAVDEEILHDKAKLICDQFLSSPIPPKCRINIQSELSSTVIENVKLGMFNRSLFHDLTINIFPLLLNYWKVFCERRHKFIPRKELTAFKRQLVLKRREKVAREKKFKSKKKNREVPVDQLPILHENLTGDGPLINYTNEKRFTQSWMDVTKSLEDTTIMNFSLSAGVKLTVPAPKTTKNTIYKVNSNEDTEVHSSRRL